MSKKPIIKMKNDCNIYIKEVKEAFNYLKNFETDFNFDKVLYAVKNINDNYIINVNVIREFNSSDEMCLWISGISLYDINGIEKIFEDIELYDLIDKYYKDIEKNGEIEYRRDFCLNYFSKDALKKNIINDLKHNISRITESFDDNLHFFVAEQIKNANDRYLQENKNKGKGR